MNQKNLHFNEQAFASFRDSLIQFYNDHFPLKKPPRTYTEFISQNKILNKNNLRPEPSLLQNAFREKRFRIIPSAGSTASNPSFRIEDGNPDNNFAKFLSEMQKLLRFDPSSTLIINAYPAAINLGNTLTTFEAAARPDLIEGFLKDYQELFEKIIIVGQPLLFLYLNRWSKILPAIAQKSCFVVGGQSLSQQQCSYIRQNLSHEKLPIVHLYGLAEIGLGVAIEEEPGRGYFCGPSKYFLEVSENNELIVSALNSSLPIFRYNSGDLANWIDSGRLEIFGKNYSSNHFRSQRAHFENLYKDPTTAQQLTGRYYFSEKLHVETWEELPNRKDYPNVQFHQAGRDLFSSLEWPHIDLLRKTGLNRG